jgi:hypothetical protein
MGVNGVNLEANLCRLEGNVQIICLQGILSFLLSTVLSYIAHFYPSCTANSLFWENKSLTASLSYHSPLFFFSSSLSFSAGEEYIHHLVKPWFESRPGFLLYSRKCSVVFVRLPQDASTWVIDSCFPAFPYLSSHNISTFDAL